MTDHRLRRWCAKGLATIAFAISPLSALAEEALSPLVLHDGIVDGELWCREITYPEAKEKLVGVRAEANALGDVTARISSDSLPGRYLLFDSGKELTWREVATPPYGYVSPPEGFTSTNVGGYGACVHSMFHISYPRGRYKDGVTLVYWLERRNVDVLICEEDGTQFEATGIHKYVDRPVSTQIHGNGYCAFTTSGRIICGIGGIGRGYLIRLDEHLRTKCPLQMPVKFVPSADIEAIIRTINLDATPPNYQAAIDAIEQLVKERGE